MSVLRTRIEQWLATREHRVSEKEAVETVLRLADVCDMAIARRHLDAPGRALLIAHAGSSAEMVSGNLVEFIGSMQSHGIDVNPILLALMREKSAGARLAALHVLRFNGTPNAVVDALLTQGLADKQAPVCERAAELACLHYRKRWLLPALSAAAQKHEALLRYQELMSQGHSLTQLEDGRYQLRLLSRSARCATSHFIEAQAVAQRGLAACVEELRASEEAREAGLPVLPVEESKLTP